MLEQFFVCKIISIVNVALLPLETVRNNSNTHSVGGWETGKTAIISSPVSDVIVRMPISALVMRFKLILTFCA
jgi:hypothetical protein